jgi:K+/H+ antiporter YhaU regulatory subunit KhtT
MNHLPVYLVQRLLKEVTLTIAGMRESVVAISERVNRKTQTLRLHWQAATLADQMEKTHRVLGRTLCDLSPSSSLTGTMGLTATHIDEHAALDEAATAVRQLKQELMQVDAAVRDLEVEALHEDLLKVQRDLTSRSAALLRIIVAPTSLTVGLPLTRLDFPVTVRVAALLRGPTLLSPTSDVPLRAGDIVIILGPQEALQRVASQFVGQGLGGLKKGPVR